VRAGFTPWRPRRRWPGGSARRRGSAADHRTGPLDRTQTGAGLLTIAALTVFPLVTLAGPAAISGHDYCLHAMTAAHATAAPRRLRCVRVLVPSHGRHLVSAVRRSRWRGAQHRARRPALRPLPGVEPRRASADGHEGQREHGDGERRYRG